MLYRECALLYKSNSTTISCASHIANHFQNSARCLNNEEKLYIHVYIYFFHLTAACSCLQFFESKAKYILHIKMKCRNRVFNDAVSRRIKQSHTILNLGATALSAPLHCFIFKFTWKSTPNKFILIDNISGYFPSSAFTRIYADSGVRRRINWIKSPAV